MTNRALFVYAPSMTDVVDPALSMGVVPGQVVKILDVESEFMIHVGTPAGSFLGVVDKLSLKPIIRGTHFDPATGLTGTAREHIC